MRRPGQLRLAALFGVLAVSTFALLAAFVVFLLLGRGGRLEFTGVNAAGLAHGLVFLIALLTGLRYLRRIVRLPSPTLLSAGLIAPPRASTVAVPVPEVDADRGIDTLLEHKVVIVQKRGVPIGVSGLRPERIVPWDEVVKVDGRAAVTELRSVLAHEVLVIVMDGRKVSGVITQEMYLGGLWGTLR